MKKTIAILLTLVMSLCLIPAVASADMTEYTLEGGTGYQTDYAVSNDGFILWGISLKGLNSNTRLSSLGFDLRWDKTQLIFGGIVETNITEINPMTGTSSPVMCDKNANYELIEGAGTPDFPTASEFYFGLAASRGATLDPTTNGVVIYLKFKVNPDIAAGTKLNIEITASNLTVANAAGTLIDPDQYTFTPVNGYIEVGSPAVDKSALESLYNSDLASLTGAVESNTPKDLPNGTRYLSTAQATVSRNALTAAKSVLDNAAATEAQVLAAYNTLLETFVHPLVVTVNTADLASAIVRAQTFIGSDKFSECSAELQALWTTALSEAQVVLANTQHTQNQCDNAAAKIKTLEQTGEGYAIYVFAGFTLLSLIGMAIAVRRRFN